MFTFAAVHKCHRPGMRLIVLACVASLCLADAGPKASDLFDLDSGSCSQREAVLDEYLSETRQLADKCDTVLDILQYDMDLVNPPHEDDEQEGLTLQNLVRNAVWTWDLESLIKRPSESTKYREEDRKVLKTAAHHLGRAHAWLVKSPTEWKATSNRKIPTSCSQHAYEKRTLAALVPLAPGQESVPTVYTVAGHTQGRYSAAWVHKRPTASGRPRIARYTTEESTSICEGASTTVLGSSRGDSIHNYRHREFVVCDSLFHQNRLETPPASKVLGQDKYVAETLLHDVFLLLARGETGKEHLFTDIPFVWKSEPESRPELPRSPKQIAMLALRPDLFKHLRDDVGNPGRLLVPDTVLLPAAYSSFCMASNLDSVEWEIKFNGWPGLENFLAHKLADIPGPDDVPELLDDGDADGDVLEDVMEIDPTNYQAWLQSAESVGLPMDDSTEDDSDGSEDLMEIDPSGETHNRLPPVS